MTPVRRPRTGAGSVRSGRTRAPSGNGRVAAGYARARSVSHRVRGVPAVARRARRCLPRALRRNVADSAEISAAPLPLQSDPKSTSRTSKGDGWNARRLGGASDSIARPMEIAVSSEAPQADVTAFAVCDPVGDLPDLDPRLGGLVDTGELKGTAGATCVLH